MPTRDDRWRRRTGEAGMLDGLDPAALERLASILARREPTLLVLLRAGAALTPSEMDRIRLIVMSEALLRDLDARRAPSEHPAPAPAVDPPADLGLAPATTTRRYAVLPRPDLGADPHGVPATSPVRHRMD